METEVKKERKPRRKSQYIAIKEEGADENGGSRQWTECASSISIKALKKILTADDGPEGKILIVCVRATYDVAKVVVRQMRLL